MTGRHPLDLTSLVFGSIFAGFALVWLLRAIDVIELDQLWLAAPVILIAAGALGLVLATRSDRDPESD